MKTLVLTILLFVSINLTAATLIKIDSRTLRGDDSGKSSSLNEHSDYIYSDDENFTKYIKEEIVELIKQTANDKASIAEVIKQLTAWSDVFIYRVNYGPDNYKGKNLYNDYTGGRGSLDRNSGFFRP